MNPTHFLSVAFAIAVIAQAAPTAAADRLASLSPAEMAVDLAAERRADPRLIVLFRGTAGPDFREVPDVDGDGADDIALCIEVDLVDAKTNNIIGTGTECLAEVDLDGTGAKPVATSYLHFPQGTLISRGKINIAPVIWDPTLNPDVDPTKIELTGYFPAPGTSNVVGGTGRFANVEGQIRMSGAARANEDGTFTIDCIFIIDLY